MRMIMGLDAPDSGSISINGQRYRDLRLPLREVGALLEAKVIHPGRSAFNHLWFLAQSNDIPRSRVTEVIRQVGLEDVAKKRAGKFSLGMGQRLGIAAALLGNPGVLLFDEPINGLDPEGILWVRNLLRGCRACFPSAITRRPDRSIGVGATGHGPPIRILRSQSGCAHSQPGADGCS